MTIPWIGLLDDRCAGCFQYRRCDAHGGLPICERCWPKRATIAARAQAAGGRRR